MVQPGGKLQLWGRGFKRGMVASFPRKSKVHGSKRRTTALVRQRGAAYAVTVPLLARSGRFTVSVPGGNAGSWNPRWYTTCPEERDRPVCSTPRRGSVSCSG